VDTERAASLYSGICPARQILDRVADKWTTLVMGILAQAQAPVRFGEFRRQIVGISQEMLTQTLRDLERDGLVVRTAYPVIPPRIEYSLTPLGETLQAPLGALAAWAHEHMMEIHAAQAAFDGDNPKKSVDPAA
jgi:DNA-binding HxlR family transcriptional regulator